MILTNTFGFSSAFGKALDARKLLESCHPTRGYPSPSEDPANPQHYLPNLVDLQMQDLRVQDKAIRRLLSANPQDAQDKELRQEITRAIRDFALTSTSYHQLSKAICLVFGRAVFWVGLILSVLVWQIG